MMGPMRPLTMVNRTCSPKNSARWDLSITEGLSPPDTISSIASAPISMIYGIYHSRMVMIQRGNAEPVTSSTSTYEYLPIPMSARPGLVGSAPRRHQCGRETLLAPPLPLLRPITSKPDYATTLDPPGRIPRIDDEGGEPDDPLVIDRTMIGSDDHTICRTQLLIGEGHTLASDPILLEDGDIGIMVPDLRAPFSE